MTACCSPAKPPEHEKKRQRAHCPDCGHPALPVQRRTVLHHACQPWMLPADAHWWVCEQPACTTVYFSHDRQLNTDAVRDLPAGKNADPAQPVCFCFGIRRHEASVPKLKAFVVEQTRNGQCDCVVRNPAGRCCLKDFPRGGG